jgi:hypothetical protein
MTVSHDYRGDETGAFTGPVPAEKLADHAGAERAGDTEHDSKHEAHVLLARMNEPDQP